MLLGAFCLIDGGCVACGRLILAAPLYEPHERSRPELCFQVLAACERHRTTPSAGDHSFTSALIWALKEMKDLPSFSTLELKTKIRQHVHLPERQIPQLSYRMGNSRPECIHLAPMGRVQDQKIDAAVDIRHQEYLDIRLHFATELTYDKVMETCGKLRALMWKDSEFARQIILIGKNRMPPHAEKATRRLHDVFKRRLADKENPVATSPIASQKGVIKVLQDSHAATHQPFLRNQAYTRSAAASGSYTVENDTAPLSDCPKVIGKTHATTCLPDTLRPVQKTSTTTSTLRTVGDERTPLLDPTRTLEGSNNSRINVKYHFQMLLRGLGIRFRDFWRRLFSTKKRKTLEVRPLPVNQDISDTMKDSGV